MLVLEIELLTGVYRAELPDRSAAEWPPHPERVFSALVQSWGDGGLDSQERNTLEWLETLPPPLIEAEDIANDYERSMPTVFVPPNDYRGEQLEVIPDCRPRQARSFRARVTWSPVVQLIWPEVIPDQHFPILQGLASRVASLGHSASLVRFAFGREVAIDSFRLWRPGEIGDTALRMIHRGRLQNLERWRAQGQRPSVGGWSTYHKPVAITEVSTSPSVFGTAADWFVFEDSGGMRPDLLGFAHVAKCVRMSLMKHAPQPPGEVISGHTPAGAMTTNPHIAIVPLANVGWPHATGDLLGFAVVLPRETNADERRPILTAVARFARIEEGDGACAELHLRGDVVWRVQRSASPSRASLLPKRWCGTAATWASATPVVLDRFADHNDPVEEASFIALACRNVGLPEPLEIEIHKHSSVHSAPSAYASAATGSRVDWSFPDDAKFSRRPRRHVVLRFAAPVEGPVILGAGRYHGFGLCLPLVQE
jgi:CRISPR-associated protein Csb2